MSCSDSVVAAPFPDKAAGAGWKHVNSRKIYVSRQTDADTDYIYNLSNTGAHTHVIYTQDSGRK